LSPSNAGASLDPRTSHKTGGVRQLPDAPLIQKRSGCSPYGPKFTVTVLEQVRVPASHTLYVKLAWPVVPVESSYKPSFGVVAITPDPWRLTSTLAEFAPLQVRRDGFIPPTFFPRPVSVIGPGVGVAVGVALGVAVGVAVGEAVGVGVAPPAAGSLSKMSFC